VAETAKQRVLAKVGPNCQVSSKSVNWKWVNGRGHRTDRQTDTESDNKGHLELSGVREPTNRPN